MKTWPPLKPMSERRALLVAIATSVVTLLVTFGFAAAMRSTQLRSLPPAAMMVVAQGGVEKERLSAAALRGRHLFLLNCAHCHGDDARGDEGPDLHNLPKSDARIHQVITRGIKGEMPSFAKKLGEPEVQQLTVYLRTLRS
jgi:mono/diheme cytochrome c family protein